MSWQAIFPNGLEVYLGGPGQVPGIGPERGRLRTNGIAKFVSPHGSYRYVWYADSVPIAALQVVSRDGMRATVANVYVVPELRRKGVATALLDRAKKDFFSVAHAALEDQSEDARAWIRGIR